MPPARKPKPNVENQDYVSLLENKDLTRVGVERAYTVFTVHFGTEYPSTYDKRSVHLLAVGFVAALELSPYRGLGHTIFKRIMRPFAAAQQDDYQ